MRITSTHKVLTLSALALAGWMGCQTAPDQSSVSEQSLNQGAELFLVVDTSSACADDLAIVKTDGTLQGNASRCAK